MAGHVNGHTLVAIGAGPAGARVIVLERRDSVGGRTASFLQDGFTFDNGSTFFLHPAVLREVFETCGRDLYREIDLRRLDPMYLLQFDDGNTFDATRDVDRLTAKAARISLDDVPNIARYLAENKAKIGLVSPIGGCNAISRTRARAARQMGVDIRLSEPAEEIVFEGRQATGVRTGRQTHAADAVVVNADFASIMQKLIPNRLRRRFSDDRIGAKKYSCSTFMLYFAMMGRLDDLQHHMIYRSGDYLENIREIDAGVAPRSRRSMCRTPRSPTRRWPPRGIQPSMCWCPPLICRAITFAPHTTRLPPLFSVSELSCAMVRLPQEGPF